MSVENIEKYITQRYVGIAFLFSTLALILYALYSSFIGDVQKGKDYIERLIVVENQLKNHKETLSSIHLADSSVNLPKLRSALKEFEDLESALFILDAEIAAFSVSNNVQAKKMYQYANAAKEQINQILIQKSSQAFVQKKLENHNRYNHMLAEQIEAAKLGLVLVQQNAVYVFSDGNKIILLVTFLCIHLIFILILRPAKKRISGQIKSLSVEKEAALRKSASQSEFLANISHEIRTPLNGILGITELLNRSTLSAEQQEYVDIIKISGGELLDKLGEISDFSRIEASKVRLTEVYFSLSELLAEIVGHFNHRIKQKELELLYIIEPSIPDQVLGDKQRIRQCLSNLIDNAIEYSHKGEIFVRISKLNKTDSMYDIQFSVSDNGIGISKSKLESIFYPRISSMDSGTKNYKSSGFGLAITAQLVQFMDGRIWAESEINKGSIFYFVLTLKAEEKIAEKSSTTREGLLKGMHVLILEPVESKRKILSLHCHNWGMFPQTTSNAAEALNILTTSHIKHFALLDYNSVMHSNGFLEKVRSFEHLKTMPLFLMATDEEQTLSVKETDSLFMVANALNTADLYSNIVQNLKIEELGTQVSDDIIEAPSPLDLSILVVEDNAINQKLISRMMSNLGYKIDLAENGKIAVLKAADKNYNLIFMDLQMPEMDGLTATRQIIAAQPPNHQIKIIAMTANVDDEDRQLCFEVGMVDYIAKPVQFDKLKSLIEYWSKVYL